MIILFCIAVIIYCTFQEIDADDHERERRRDFSISERRHRELLNEVKKSRSGNRKRRTRTVAKTRNGTVIAQEIEENL